ncbi:MAG: hypothetical protein V8T45_02665 [Oscillospiraceae bacterium]
MSRLSAPHLVANQGKKPQDFEAGKNFKKIPKNLKKTVDKRQIKCYINQALRCCGHLKSSQTAGNQMKRFEKSC